MNQGKKILIDFKLSAFTCSQMLLKIKFDSLRLNDMFISKLKKIVIVT